MNNIRDLINRYPIVYKSDLLYYSFQIINKLGGRK